jgi:lipopolysaccharide transport system permease protein
MGIVWVLSLVALVVRDVQQLIGILSMAIMVLSPMAYTPEMVPGAIKFVLWLNPLSYFVLCFQAVLALGRPPDPMIFAIAAALGCGSAFLGYKFFRKAKFIFIDYA